MGRGLGKKLGARKAELRVEILNFGLWILDEDQERDAPATLEEGVSVACGSVARWFGGSVWKRRFNRQVAKEEEGDFGW